MVDPCGPNWWRWFPCLEHQKPLGPTTQPPGRSHHDSPERMDPWRSIEILTPFGLDCHQLTQPAGCMEKCLDFCGKNLWETTCLFCAYRQTWWIPVPKHNPSTTSKKQHITQPKMAPTNHIFPNSQRDAKKGEKNIWQGTQCTPLISWEETYGKSHGKKPQPQIDPRWALVVPEPQAPRAAHCYGPWDLADRRSAAPGEFRNFWYICICTSIEEVWTELLTHTHMYIYIYWRMIELDVEFCIYIYVYTCIHIHINYADGMIVGCKIDRCWCILIQVRGWASRSVVHHISTSAGLSRTPSIALHRRLPACCLGDFSLCPLCLWTALELSMTTISYYITYPILINN